MIRSTNRDLGEYDLIRQPDHISKVWAAIETTLPKYWQTFLQSEAERNVPSGAFTGVVESYEKESEKYREFFNSDALEEYLDDPNSFKQGLLSDVPVIANTMRARRPELKEWQGHFRSARSNDLLEVFTNMMEFADNWAESHTKDNYVEFDELGAFDLDPLDDDESMRIFNVIGMGIKSIVLYHNDSERFPSRGHYGLYGLYFLSGRDHFNLPSESSEFLMINDVNPASDGSIIMDQNYWYPYGLFSLYSLRLYKWIERQLSSAGVKLDRSVRYVYVERFFKSVCDQHRDDLRTMRAHERFEIPW